MIFYLFLDVLLFIVHVGIANITNIIAAIKFAQGLLNVYVMCSLSTSWFKTVVALERTLTLDNNLIIHQLNSMFTNILLTMV